MSQIKLLCSPILFSILTIYFHQFANAQVVLNEGSNKNGSLIYDEDFDYEDWIEIYNAGPDIINLSGYTISDDADSLGKWEFPSLSIAANQFLFLYASSKNRKPISSLDHWEMPVNELTEWGFRIPNASTPSEWIENYFDFSGWTTSTTSVGYGDDDDDFTVADGTLSLYLKTTFDVSDTSLIGDAILHMDYDDGFIAYLNGNVIAMNGFLSGSPAYDALSGVDHEALMYQGYNPEAFTIDEATLKYYLVEGVNFLSVEVHNVNPTSSDLTIRPFLSFGIKDGSILWDTYLPAWYTTAAYSSNLHTNFKIDPDGETIYLSNSLGEIIDSLFIGGLDIDYSIGKKTDGSDTIKIFSTPTPNYSNNSSTPFDGFVSVPVFDLEAGFYSGSQIVSITAPIGTNIYVTMDGNIPDETDFLYSGPITIDLTTVIKARCFDADGILLPGKTITNTYFIDEEISVPVISITSDDENLYGPEGILDNWWTDWKRHCYIEYFDSLNIQAFEQNSGVKVDGGAGGSRYYEQKSLRIEPDHSAFGDGVLNYPIHLRKPWIENHESFYLRNGSNFYNVLPYKDGFMTRTTEGTNTEHMAYSGIVVFLNGEYFGLYELREKLDAGFFRYNYEIEKENLDLLSVSYWYGGALRAVEGSDTDFVEMRNTLFYYPTPSDTDFYHLADSMLDLKNFTDYLICETWLGNTDWLWNNMKIWRDRGGDNKWKYGVIDVEWGIGYGWADAYSDNINYLIYTPYNIEQFNNLMLNERFHNDFINRYADLMNTTFLPERTLAMEDSIYNIAIEELPRNWEKWGSGSLIYDYNTFVDYRDAIRNDFEIRSGQVRNHIEYNYALDGQVEINLEVEPAGAGRIKISTLTIFDLPWSGIYFNGVPVQITAEANTGYTFENWDENDFIDDVLNPTFKNNFTSNQTFIAHFSGSPELDQITISEINYNNEPSVNSGNWIELYNYGTADVNIGGWKMKDANPIHQFIIPDGIILHADERIVLIDHDTLFTNENPDVDNYLGSFNFGLDNTSETIQLYDAQNNLKISLQYIDSLPWPLGADGQGRTLELINPLLDLSDGNNWFDGCIGGSPGVAYTPCIDAIIISEINYNSADTANSNDWIEMRNISSENIAIGGWKFMDDSTGSAHEFYIPDGKILLPNENYVLAQTESTFNIIYPDIVNYTSPFEFNLSGGGEWIRMYDETGKLKISIRYNDALPWPTEADGNGYTLELIDSLGLMNSGNNWTIICPQGSPGMYATDLCSDTIVIDTSLQINMSSIFAFEIYPNPADQFINLSLEFQEEKNVEFNLLNLQGNLVKHIESMKMQVGQNHFLLDIKNLSSGIYFVEIKSDAENEIIKFVKE